MTNVATMHVLLVEDDAGIREGMVELLSDFGAVSEASDVRSALEILERQGVTLVITDLNIGGNGEGGYQIAAAAQGRGIRVFLMTGASRAEIERASAVFQPAAIIEKPFSVDDVLAMLERERQRTG